MALFGFKLEHKEGNTQFGIIEHKDNYKGDIARDVNDAIVAQFGEEGFSGTITVMTAEELIREQYKGFCYLTNSVRR